MIYTEQSYKALYNKWRDELGYPTPDVNEATFDMTYQGSFNTWADWATSFVADMYAKSDGSRLPTYFDYDAFIHDIRASGEYYAIEHDGQLAIFASL